MIVTLQDTSLLMGLPCEGDPSVLDDEVTVVVRHVRGVRRPQGAEAVRLLPRVACAYGAHCSERPP
jgi:hypothetical protein